MKTSKFPFDISWPLIVVTIWYQTRISQNTSMWSRTDWWCTTLFMMHILMSLKVESWNDVNDGWISHYGNKGGRTQPFDRGNFLLLIGIRMWHPWWTTQHTAQVFQWDENISETAITYSHAPWDISSIFFYTFVTWMFHKRFVKTQLHKNKNANL